MLTQLLRLPVLRFAVVTFAFFLGSNLLWGQNSVPPNNSGLWNVVPISGEGEVLLGPEEYDFNFMPQNGNNFEANVEIMEITLSSSDTSLLMFDYIMKNISQNQMTELKVFLSVPSANNGDFVEIISVDESTQNITYKLPYPNETIELLFKLTGNAHSIGKDIGVYPECCDPLEGKVVVSTKTKNTGNHYFPPYIPVSSNDDVVDVVTEIVFANLSSIVASEVTVIAELLDYKGEVLEVVETSIGDVEAKGQLTIDYEFIELPAPMLYFVRYHAEASNLLIPVRLHYQVFNYGGGCDMVDEYDNYLDNDDIVDLLHKSATNVYNYVASLEDNIECQDQSEAMQINNSDYVTQEKAQSKESISTSLTDFAVFPNPFQDYLELSYTVSEPSPVQITIYDMLGKQMNIILSTQKQEEGTYHITNNFKNIPKGSYFLILQIGDNTKRVKLLKLN